MYDITHMHDIRHMNDIKHRYDITVLLVIELTFASHILFALWVGGYWIFLGVDPAVINPYLFFRPNLLESFMTTWTSPQTTIPPPPPPPPTHTHTHKKWKKSQARTGFYQNLMYNSIGKVLL